MNTLNFIKNTPNCSYIGEQVFLIQGVPFLLEENETVVYDGIKRLELDPGVMSIAEKQNDIIDTIKKDTLMSLLFMVNMTLNRSSVEYTTDDETGAIHVGDHEVSINIGTLSINGKNHSIINFSIINGENLLVIQFSLNKINEHKPKIQGAVHDMIQEIKKNERVYSH